MMISIAGGLVFIGVLAFVYLEVQEKAVRCKMKLNS